MSCSEPEIWNWDAKARKNSAGIAPDEHRHAVLVIETFCAGPASFQDGVARASLLEPFGGKRIRGQKPADEMKVTREVGVMVGLRWFAVAGVAVLGIANYLEVMNDARVVDQMKNEPFTDDDEDALGI